MKQIEPANETSEYPIATEMIASEERAATLTRHRRYESLKTPDLYGRTHLLTTKLTK